MLMPRKVKHRIWRYGDGTCSSITRCTSAASASSSSCSGGSLWRKRSVCRTEPICVET